MQLGDFVNEDSVARHGTSTVEQTTFFFLQLTQHTVHRIDRSKCHALLVYMRQHDEATISATAQPSAGSKTPTCLVSQGLLLK